MLNLNLSDGQPRVLAEAYRVLGPGGHFGISDVLAHPGLAPAQRAEAEQFTGCAATVTAIECRSPVVS